MEDLSEHIKGWAKLVTELERDPIPRGAADLVGLELVQRYGEEGTFAAAAWAVQLDTFARPSETLALRPCELFLPSPEQDGSYRKAAVLRFGDPEVGPSKSGQYDTHVRVGVKPREWMLEVVQCLWDISRPLPGHERFAETIFGDLSYPRYCRLIEKAAESAGLGVLDVTPHVARHTGASEDHFQGIRDLKEIQLRGRWESESSVRRYAKHARLIAALAKCPVEVKAKFPAASKEYPQALIRALKEIRQSQLED